MSGKFDLDDPDNDVEPGDETPSDADSGLDTTEPDDAQGEGSFYEGMDVESIQLDKDEDRGDVQVAETVDCPKCGFANERGKDSCDSCGVIFSKLESSRDRPPRSGPDRKGSSASSSGSDRFSGGLPIGRLIAGLVVAAVVAWVWLSKPYEVVGADLGSGRPVVVMLHGYGAAGDDLVPRAERLAERLPDTTFVVPAAPHGWVRKAWMSGGTGEQVRGQVAESRALILRTVEDIEAAGHSPNDIYLAGFSQGSQMALDIAGGEEVGRSFGGLILMSGGWPNWPESVPPLDDANLVEGARILISHGNADRVIATSQSRDIVRHFHKLDMRVETVFFDGGHSIPDTVHEKTIEVLEDH